MGMAELALTPRTEWGASVDYQRIGIRRLREMARGDHPEHTDEAPRAFVMRALDMEVERRTLHDERWQGYGASPIAPGYAPGGTDIAREPLAGIYDRGIREHRDHEFVRQFIASARLPDRQLFAVLVQAAKSDRRSNGPRAMSFEQIAANPGPWGQLLGWGGVEPVPGHSFDCFREEQRDKGTVRVRETHRVLAFKDGKAITNAASQARTQLILLAQVPRG